MRNSFVFLACGLSLGSALGCSSSAESSPTTTGNAGTTATGGGGGSSGTPGGGASGAMGGGAGGVGSGGATGGGAGGTATGGGGAGGVSGGAGGSGGTAGSGGVAGNGGAGGAVGHVAVPSMGCGNVDPPSGALTIETGGETGAFNVFLPEDYDPMTPMPLGFGFHGFGNDECGPDNGECRGFKELPAVTVYMKSISDGWEQGDVLEQNVTYFQDVLERMKSEYCIDESRIFIAGVSSGGQFISHLTCRFGDTLWQVSPVCAGAVQLDNCVGTPPILVIHGVTDQAGGYGEDTAALFAERNGCSPTPPAGLEQAKADLMEAFNAQEDEHVCMDWDGCTANPVRFCLSSQITYDGLTHGWPEIGGQLIGEFQATLE